MFLYEKTWGTPKKQHCCFCCRFKNIGNIKNTFFPIWPKFRISTFEINAPNRRLRAPDLEICFSLTFGKKKLWVNRNCGRGPPHLDFMPFFRKIVLCKTYFRIYHWKYGIKVEIWGPPTEISGQHTLLLCIVTLTKNELQGSFICGDTSFYKKEKGKMRKKAP